MGPFANVSDSTFEHLQGTDAQIGFMLESKGLAHFPDAAAFASWALKNTATYKFVRIATTFDELGVAVEIAKILLDQGKEVFVNIMRASELSTRDLRQISETVCAGISGLYLADSFGSLAPEETASLVSSLASEGHRVGFHAHNNRGMAFANSLAAIRSGATLVDGTMAGHGRGSGNAKIEELAAEIEPYSSALMANLFDIGEHLDRFEYSPEDTSGENSFAFHLGAKLGLHPNLIMNVFSSSPTLGLGEVLTVIGQSVNSSSLDEDPKSLVRSSSSDSSLRGDEAVKFDLRGKRFFLFARGLSLLSDYSDFEHFSGSREIASGFLNGVPDGMSADLVFALHPFRRGVVSSGHRGLSATERVCAFSEPPDFDSKGIWTHIPAVIQGLNFGEMSVGNSLQIPVNTVLAYALGILGSSGVEEVCLGGFDTSIDPVEAEENRLVLEKFQEAFGSVRLSTVGVNNYGLEKVSLW